MGTGEGSKEVGRTLLRIFSQSTAAEAHSSIQAPAPSAQRVNSPSRQQSWGGVRCRALTVRLAGYTKYALPPSLSLSSAWQFEADVRGVRLKETGINDDSP